MDVVSAFGDGLFADDIVANLEEKEKADVLVDRLGTTATRRKMEMVMTR